MFLFHSFRINSKFIILIQALLSFSFAIIILYPNLSAKWSNTDDHEIIDFMGKDHQLSYKEIPHMLMKTEVGFSGVPRYRPTYYLLKLIETASWGNNPLFWYAFRIGLLGTSIFITWMLLGRFMGKIAGGLVCLVFLSHSFWQEQFLEFIGPAEHYCMIGLALYCLAFVNLWKKKISYSTNIWWGILAFGAIVCMGSKENFLLLIPITLILFYYAWKDNQLNKFCIFINSLLFAFGLFVTIATIIVLKQNNGLDIYSNSVSPISRFNVLLSGFFSLSHMKIQFPFWISLILVLIAWIFHYIRRDNISDAILNRLRYLLLAEAVCVLVWYSQFVFYNGLWPSNSRYDFPGVLAQDLAYILLIFSPLTIIKTLTSSLTLKRLIKVLYAMLIIFFSVYIMQYGIHNYINIYTTSIIHRNITQNTEEAIFEAIRRAKDNPSAPIIIICNKLYDLEGVWSIGKLLSAYCDNPIILDTYGLTESECKNDLELHLLKQLIKLSKGGELQYYSLKPKFCSAQTLRQPFKPCAIIRIKSS
jgi:hypothetical protein